GFDLLFVARILGGHDLLEGSTLVSELLGQLLPLDVAVDHGGLCHFGFLDESVTERELERCQQRLRFRVGLRSGGDGDIHATDRVDGVEVDFREDDLFLHTHVEVAATVEGTTGNTTEVAHARQRDVDQAVHELVHLFTTQRGLASSPTIIADLERRSLHPRRSDDRYHS